MIVVKRESSSEIRTDLFDHRDLLRRQSDIDIEDLQVGSHVRFDRVIRITGYLNRN